MTAMEMQHEPEWHLAEAERLLDEARKADEGRHPEERPWKFSYTERAQAHTALAVAVAATRKRRLRRR